MSDLSQEEWAEQLENDNNAFILDVRTPEEVEEGYIPGATNIDIYLGQEFVDELEKLDKKEQKANKSLDMLHTKRITLSEYNERQKQINAPMNKKKRKQKADQCPIILPPNKTIF